MLDILGSTLEINRLRHLGRWMRLAPTRHRTAVRPTACALTYQPKGWSA
ncbi:MAG: hypothetical protein U1E77_00485 [Inhella sp.]